MTPTTRFRYVERTVPINETTGKRVNILQQWWEQKQWAHDDWIIVGGEWRDIPLEVE